MTGAPSRAGAAGAADRGTWGAYAPWRGRLSRVLDKPGDNLVRSLILSAAVGCAAGAIAAQARAPFWAPEAVVWGITRAILGATWIGYLAISLAGAVRRCVYDWRRRSAVQRVAILQSAREVRPLPWAEIIRRATLVAAVPLARYLGDPSGGSIAGWWLLIILVCGYVYVEHACGAGSRWARAYWLAAALFLVPWGVPAWSARWPPGGAF